MKGAFNLTDARALYLNLMKKRLTYYIWGETTEPFNLSGIRSFYIKIIINQISKFLEKNKLQLLLNL